MTDLPGIPMPTTGWSAVGPCPECGAEPMRAVSDGFGTNFYCASCGACWFFTMGVLGRVDPFNCPGCSETQRDVCRARAGSADEARDPSNKR